MSESQTTISPDEAAEILEHMVMDFRNQMVRQKVDDMTPRQWADEWASWFDRYHFEREARVAQEFLAELKR